LPATGTRASRCRPARSGSGIGDFRAHEAGREPGEGVEINVSCELHLVQLNLEDFKPCVS
jgi:hypothetical protein